MSKINEFLEFYKIAKPGKYWSLPKNKRDMADTMLYNENYYAGAKSDGEWARLIVGEDYVLMQSRNIAVGTGTYGDKTASVPHIIHQAKITYPAGTVLLGELCFDDPTKTSKDVGSIMRCLPAKAIERQNSGPKLMFKVFDVLAMAGMKTHELKAEDRKSIIENMPVGGHIQLTEFSDNPKELLDKVFAAGGEGIVLMKRDEQYKFGNKKAWHSIKIKKSMGELEALVTGTTQPNMIYDGTSLQTWRYWQIVYEDESMEYVEMMLHDYLVKGKQIVVAGKNVKQAMPITRFYYKKWPAGVTIVHNGKQVTLASGLTDEDRIYLTQQGKTDIQNRALTAVYSGMEPTEDGSVRHPYLVRFRDEA